MEAVTGALVKDEDSLKWEKTRGLRGNEDKICNAWQWEERLFESHTSCTKRGTTRYCKLHNVMQWAATYEAFYA